MPDRTKKRVATGPCASHGHFWPSVPLSNRSARPILPKTRLGSDHIRAGGEHRHIFAYGGSWRWKAPASAAEKSASKKPMLVGKGGIGVCCCMPRHSSELVDKLDEKLSKNDHSEAAAEHFCTVRLMLGRSWSERNCERREPKNVSRPLDGLASGRRRT